MKTNNYFVIIFVLIFSLIISIFIPSLLFKTNNNVSIETVPRISNGFSTPSTQFFNSNSIDLTPYTQIGNGSNSSPFGTSSTN